jgi:hypothetical protein
MTVNFPAALLPSERRTFGLGDPRQQFVLAVIVLGITSLFLALAVGNSYAAYGSLLNSTVAIAPQDLGSDLVAQTRNYVVVSSALLIGYALAMIGASIAFVHRVSGPLVAVRRHVHALKMGRYSSRVTLRGIGGLHSELACQLNELAVVLEGLEKHQRSTV